MQYILNLFPNFAVAFSALWWVFIHGGWVVFVILVIYLLWELYFMEIKSQFRNDQPWVFLLIRAPRDNEVSLLAIEQIYSQLHALHVGYTWPEMYVEGRTQLWYSFEIVSLGGKISMIIRTPKKMRDTVEAAFYSQYPSAEITEVRDYLENVEYHPGHSDFDLFGFEMNLLKPDVIPLKSYTDFEHSTAEQKVVDPLAALFESMGKMEPHEFYGVQILAQPIADKEWAPRAEKLARKFLGEEVEEEVTLGSMIVHALQLYNPFYWLEKIFSKEEEHEEKSDKKEKNNLMQMTEIEKDRVHRIQKKAGKPGYLCKIRLLYMAPQDKFDNSKKSIIVGAFRTLGDDQFNGLKPDTRETWTGMNYRISPTLQEPFINYIVNKRKHHMFNGYKGRSYLIGRPQYVLNIEELATLFHLPLSVPGAATISAVDRVDSKKSQPPPNLPVG